MTEKKLSETSDSELILEYLEQLKEDNSRLKKELKAKNRPIFDFASLTGLLRDIAGHWFPQTVLVVSLIVAGILLIYGLAVFHGPNGKFYVERKGTVTIQSIPECTQPPPIQKPCFRVVSEVDLGQDDYISDCYDNKDEAYKAAAEFTEEWKKLNESSKAMK